MHRSTASASVDKSFDRFLQAPIDEDRNERVLSVLSALARLDLDPWIEAAALARLPTDAAIQRLAALIVTMPDASAVPRDAAGIATRLVARLPSSRPVPGDSQEQAEHPDKGSDAFTSEPSPARGSSLTMIALIVTAILLMVSMITGRPPQALFGVASPTHSSAAASLKVTPRPGPAPDPAPATPTAPTSR